MKKMGRDIKVKKRPVQAKTALISYSSANSLESRVSVFLMKAKGSDSIAEFAAKLGIPRMSLSRYLNCEQSMSLSTLQKIAKALGVKPGSILK
jgi:transcriptional regulator with XRE-family HTH domain